VKDRTYPIRADVVKEIMANKNISISDLADATRMSRKGISNILNKRNDPLEGNLVLIAAALGVKWTTLVDGYEGKIVEEGASGGVSVITSERYIVDLRKGVSQEDAIRKLTARFAKSIKIADEIHITILRESDEDSP
jgi:transcriptional regulator with XRE-family HTH domain